MAESRFNKVYNVLTNYNFIINEDIQEDFLCKICKKIMVDPYSGLCGCHYCFRCIKDYIGDEQKYCPGGAEDCFEEYLEIERNVLKNLITRRNIANMMMKCPNEACFFRSKLEDMGDHVGICTMIPTECPFKIMGCINEGLREDNVIDHLNLDKLKHSQLIVEAINHLKNDVHGLKQNFDAKEREINEIKEENENNKRQIEEVEDNCHRKETLMRLEIGELKDEIRIIKENEVRIELQNDVMKQEEIIMKEEVKIIKTDIVNMKNKEERNTKAIIYSQKKEKTMTHEINELKFKNEVREKKDIEDCQRIDKIVNEINEIKETLKILNGNEEKRQCDNEDIKKKMREIVMMKNEIFELKKKNEDRNAKDIGDFRRKEKMINEIIEIKENIKVLNDKEERRKCDNEEIRKKMKEIVIMKNEINELKMLNEERNQKDIEDGREKEEIMSEIKEIKENMEILKDKEKSRKCEIEEIKKKPREGEVMMKNEYEKMMTTVMKVKKNIKEFFEVEVVNVGNNRTNKEEEIWSNNKEDFVWKIKDFTKKINEYGMIKYLSDVFYKDDYKLCLRAVIGCYNGDIDNGCVYLSVCIMREEKDERVQKPMKHKITINIINQDSQKIHECLTVNYDESQDISLFYKERYINKYIDCGVIHYNDILEIIKNDSVVIGCSLSSK